MSLKALRTIAALGLFVGILAALVGIALLYLIDYDDVETAYGILIAAAIAGTIGAVATAGALRKGRDV